MPHQTDRPYPLTLRQRDEIYQLVVAARRDGKTVGLVPTMGSLHAGHLSLAEASTRECDLTVVTIFVNPTQFGEGEDFEAYPRDLENDLQKLADVGADIVFAPPSSEVYCEGHATHVVVSDVAKTLEGRCRPGHFAGVATVVLKLFNMIPADVAYFGQKDYQQAMVIGRMIRDLDVRINLRICPTVRDADGLALSSRNAYLSDEERNRALSLSHSLKLAAELIADGQREAASIIRQMRATIEDAGNGDMHIDYVALADPETLRPVTVIDSAVVALLAVRVGKARLIDNMVIDPAADSAATPSAGEFMSRRTVPAP